MASHFKDNKKATERLQGAISLQRHVTALLILSAIALLYWGGSELAHPGPIFRADPNAGVPVLSDLFIYLNTCGNIAGTIYTGRSLRLQREDLAKKVLKQQQQHQQLKASPAAPTVSAQLPRVQLASLIEPALSKRQHGQLVDSSSTAAIDRDLQQQHETESALPNAVTEV